MRPGSHAADDGSFGRSATIQTGRAVVLIGVAVLVGLILLHRNPGQGASTSVSVTAPGDTTTPSLSPTSPSSRTGGSTPASTAKPTATTGTTPLRAPQDIKVLVANGTTTSGLAGKISNTVHAKGYNTLASTNSTQKPPSTVVYFQPSYSADAASLAAKLNLPATAVQAMPQPPPVQTLNGANILIIVGPDLANAGSTTSST